MSAIASQITADDTDCLESLFYGPDAIDIASDKDQKGFFVDEFLENNVSCAQQDLMKNGAISPSECTIEEDYCKQPVTDLQKARHNVALYTDFYLSSAMRSVWTEGNLIPVSPAAGNLEVTSPSYLPLMEGNAAMAKVSVPSYNAPTIRKKDCKLKRKLSSSPESRKNLDLEDDKNQQLEDDVENAGSLSQQKTFGGCSEPSCNYTSYLCDVNEDISSGPSRSMTDFGKEGTIHLPRDCFVEKASGGQNRIKQIRKLNMQSGDAMSPMTPRFSRHPSPDLRTRDLSPCAETQVGNKRHEMICAFYAKGWCIRGNSCSFLHIKDPENKSGQQIEGELVTQNWKREVQPEEGAGDDVKRSRMPCTQVPLAATQERTSQYSSEFSSNPIIQKEVSPSWHPNKSWAVSSFPSSLTHTEGMTTTQRLDMHHGYTSQFESHSPNVNMATHLPTAYSQQLLNSGMACHDTRSPFSGSEREGLALNGSFGVPPHPTGCRSSVEDQKDPFDSIVEVPNIGDESLKAFISSQRTPILTSSQVPTNGESVEAANQGSDLHGAKSSVSQPEKSCVPHEKSFVTTETDTMAATYLNCQFGRVGMGLNPFEEVKSIGKEQTERDARPQVEVTEDKKQRVDRGKKNSEMDNNLQKDAGVQIESMELRNFRFALVDHVKEILRPVWLEGDLSKDAHNMIVKKSVDKIINTLQPQQIPTNEDSIKKYLSFCQLKIVNLVKGYTSIYGKIR
ncbi:protein FRIGIDA-ESSENTIAL 1-like [Neltuma alba]|uniref:protein FRIGIDA-ESSENTIAL 1-like n=1 Tax=Neltuma alba TaxID=207710 RepID=UPI0010A4FE7A|nr:protein FRIGIDA-ESSENTIAL 1-like [Prosopis alba]